MSRSTIRRVHVTAITLLFLAMLVLTYPGCSRNPATETDDNPMAPPILVGGGDGESNGVIHLPDVGDPDDVIELVTLPDGTPIDPGATLPDDTPVVVHYTQRIDRSTWGAIKLAYYNGNGGSGG